jgi:hypothetical protein
MHPTEARQAWGHDLAMNTQDLSGAYGDHDDNVSWFALIGIVIYSLTIGWVAVLIRCILLYGTSPQSVAAHRQESRRAVWN